MPRSGAQVPRWLRPSLVHSGSDSGAQSAAMTRELHLTEKVAVDESVGKPDIGCGRFVTRGNTH